MVTESTISNMESKKNLTRKTTSRRPNTHIGRAQVTWWRAEATHKPSCVMRNGFAECHEVRGCLSSSSILTTTDTQSLVQTCLPGHTSLSIFLKKSDHLNGKHEALCKLTFSYVRISIPHQLGHFKSSYKPMVIINFMSSR